MKTIPLCDLKEQYQTIKDEVLKCFDQVCSDSAFIKSSYVKKFENEFIKKNNAQFGVGCSNGTSAISLALEALEIGPGDEVILPSHTFMATAEAICHVGATPVFADIKPCDYTVDPKDIERKITSRTRCLIPVHIYGTPCDMDEIMELAQKNNLRVVEDCAQSHFAKYKGRYVGTFGDAGTFSFYPGKNLGAYGDAGFVLCQSKSIEEKIKKLTDHGRLGKFDHEVIGYNHRLDALQAVVLSIKLNYIEQWTQSRKVIAKTYDDEFRNFTIKVITHSEEKDCVHHVYVMETKKREVLQEKLLKDGIQTGIHYPIPTHKLKPFQKWATSLPITEDICKKIVSLPIYPELREEDQRHIIKTILEKIEN